MSLTAEARLAASTIRGYQTDLRLFSEYLADGRYGWAVECEKAFCTYPVPIAHEWNTIAHLNEYEGNPEASGSSTMPTSRWSGRSKPSARARLRPTGTPPCSR